MQIPCIYANKSLLFIFFFSCSVLCYSQYNRSASCHPENPLRTQLVGYRRHFTENVKNSSETTEETAVEWIYWCKVLKILASFLIHDKSRVTRRIIFVDLFPLNRPICLAWASQKKKKKKIAVGDDVRPKRETKESFTWNRWWVM